MVWNSAAAGLSCRPVGSSPPPRCPVPGPARQCPSCSELQQSPASTPAPAGSRPVPPRSAPAPDRRFPGYCGRVADRLSTGSLARFARQHARAVRAGMQAHRANEVFSGCVGIDFQDLPVNRLCFLKPTGLVMFEGEREFFGERGHVANYTKGNTMMLNSRFRRLWCQGAAGRAGGRQCPRASPDGRPFWLTFVSWTWRTIAGKKGRCDFTHKHLALNRFRRASAILPYRLTALLRCKR